MVKSFAFYNFSWTQSAVFLNQGLLEFGKSCAGFYYIYFNMFAMEFPGNWKKVTI